jgi:hypothetical protein
MESVKACFATCTEGFSSFLVHNHREEFLQAYVNSSKDKVRIPPFYGVYSKMRCRKCGGVIKPYPAN